MEIEFDRADYKKKLEGLRALPHFKDEKVWQSAVCSVALRSALRVLPFLAVGGSFNYWNEDEQLDHLKAIRAALSVVFVDSVNAEGGSVAAAYSVNAVKAYSAVADADADAVAYADVAVNVVAVAVAAYSDAVEAYSSAYPSPYPSAYLAASEAAAYFAEAYSAYSSYSVNAIDAAAAADDVSDKLRDELAEHSRNDFNLLRHSKSDLNAVPLWRKEATLLNSDVMGQWRGALVKLGNEDFALWYDGFLEGNPDAQGTLNWLNQWLRK